jgi:predicted ribosome quality control (RQC) complex YloA/Tae2 family protein
MEAEEAEAEEEDAEDAEEEEEEEEGRSSSSRRRRKKLWSLKRSHLFDSMLSVCLSGPPLFNAPLCFKIWGL